MENQSFCKEHKGYVVGGILAVIVLIVIVSAFREFRENRMGIFDRNYGNSYQRSNNERGYEQNFGNCGGRRLLNDKNGFGNNPMMENKVSLPLNAISIADASKIATATIPGSKVTQVYLESEAGILNYSIILDNKTEIKVDAINGKIVTDKNDDTNETNENNSGTGKLLNK